MQMELMDERRHKAHVMQETSLEAYNAADLAGAEQRVFDYLVRCGERGSTDDEGWRALGMLKDSYAPARNRLMNANLVVKTRSIGNKVVRRPTASGRSAIVWRLRKEYLR